jgi:hypothetical protein
MIIFLFLTTQKISMHTFFSKHFILVFCCCFLVFLTESQNIQPCFTPQHLCSGSVFTIIPNNAPGLGSMLNISNPTTNPASSNSGCVNTGGVHVYWFLITVISSGNLEFAFGLPNTGNPQSGFYDWIMWPYSISACASIFGNSLPPVRCNWNFVATGGTGIGNVPIGSNPANFEPSLPVTAGQQFLIMLDNYSAVNTLVTFSSTGTALLGCDQVFNPGIAACPGQPVVYTANSYSLGTPSFTLQPGNHIQSSPVFTLNAPATSVFTILTSGIDPNTNQPVNYTSSFTFSALISPTVTVSNQVHYCDPSPVDFTVNPLSTYSTQVFGPAGFNGNFSTNPITLPNVASSANGIYTVNVIYPNGCIRSSTAAIDVSPITQVSINPSSTVCAGENFFLSASVPATASYSWQGPASFSSPFQNNMYSGATALNAGVYTVTAKYTHGSVQCEKTNTTSVSVDLCTGLSEMAKETITVWPNPANEIIYFSGLNTERIEIVSFSGIVKDLPFNGNKIITGSLNEGVYLLRFYDGKALLDQRRILILK